MNLPSPNLEEGCESWVSLGEDHPSSGSFIGPKKFCGLTVPNYPGPSVITSASNSIVVSYNLPADSLVRGHSFQVAASAVNPHCSATAFIHKYGSSSCDASCGQNILPPGKQDLP